MKRDQICYFRIKSNRKDQLNWLGWVRDCVILIINLKVDVLSSSVDCNSAQHHQRSQQLK